MCLDGSKGCVGECCKLSVLGFLQGTKSKLPKYLGEEGLHREITKIFLLSED